MVHIIKAGMTALYVEKALYVILQICIVNVVLWVWKILHRNYFREV